VIYRRYIGQIKNNQPMKNIKNYGTFSLNETDLDSPLHPMEQKLTLTGAIERSMRTKAPILFISGKPAAEAAQAADDLRATLISIDAEFMRPEGFGIPAIGGGYGPPSFLPYGSSKDPMILLIYDLNRANRQVLRAAKKLASVRGLGEYTLPENCTIVLSFSSPDEAETYMGLRMDNFITVQP
jgi:hypothetical protein